MSQRYKEFILEQLFDQFYAELIEEGYTEEDASIYAEELAWKRFEEAGE
jgi:hypothetical protein